MYTQYCIGQSEWLSQHLPMKFNKVSPTFTKYFLISQCVSMVLGELCPAFQIYSKHFLKFSRKFCWGQVCFQLNLSWQLWPGLFVCIFIRLVWNKVIVCIACGFSAHFQTPTLDLPGTSVAVLFSYPLNPSLSIL